MLLRNINLFYPLQPQSHFAYTAKEGLFSFVQIISGNYLYNTESPQLSLFVNHCDIKKWFWNETGAHSSPWTFIYAVSNSTIKLLISDSSVCFSLPGRKSHNVKTPKLIVCECQENINKLKYLWLQNKLEYFYIYTVLRRLSLQFLRFVAPRKKLSKTMEETIILNTGWSVKYKFVTMMNSTLLLFFSYVKCLLSPANEILLKCCC